MGLPCFNNTSTVLLQSLCHLSRGMDGVEGGLIGCALESGEEVANRGGDLISKAFLSQFSSCGKFIVCFFLCVIIFTVGIFEGERIASQIWASKQINKHTEQLRMKSFELEQLSCLIAIFDYRSKLLSFFEHASHTGSLDAPIAR
jgi:hypothetical protein